MRLFGFFSFLLGIVAFVAIEAAPLNVIVSAESAIVMNAETGAILFEKNPHRLQYPASVTKIATALYALKKKGAYLDEKVVADQESVALVSPEAKVKANYRLPFYWLEPGSSHIGIKPGEILSLRDLLYGMMIPSGNDAANVVAQHVSGDISRFIQEVNAYLKQLGCENTTFLNPHGLHHPEHRTTAYDMALLTREALKDPTFRQIVKTVRYKRPKTNLQEATVFLQTNRLLKHSSDYYEKAIGVKTGRTSRALNTFVAAAEHGGRTLIAVLLKVKERGDIFRDAARLFETAFTQPKVQRVLLKAGLQKFFVEVPGARRTIKTYTTESLTLEYYPAEELQFKTFLAWDPLALPIDKGQRVGEVRVISLEGKILKTVPLLSRETVHSMWLYRVLGWMEGAWGSSISFKVCVLFLFGAGCFALGSRLIKKH